MRMLVVLVVSGLLAALASVLLELALDGWRAWRRRK